MRSLVRDVWDRWRDDPAPEDGSVMHAAASNLVVPSVPGIRPRRRDDIGACIRLLNVVHLEDRYPPSWPVSPRAWLTGDEILDAFVVDRLREILGHVAVTRVGAEATASLRWRELTGLPTERLGGVGRLFVRRKARRQGIGGALLDTAAEAVRSRGLVPVLDAVSDSAVVLPLAHAHGWRLLATYPLRGSESASHAHYYWLPS